VSGCEEWVGGHGIAIASLIKSMPGGVDSSFKSRTPGPDTFSDADIWLRQHVAGRHFAGSPEVCNAMSGVGNSLKCLRLRIFQIAQGQI